jgi:hypothetical protein
MVYRHRQGGTKDFSTSLPARLRMKILERAGVPNCVAVTGKAGMACS